MCSAWTRRRRPVIIEQAPTFVGSTTAAFVLGAEGTFTVTTDGFPRPDLEVTSGTLPAGLTFTDNGDGTATVERHADRRGFGHPRPAGLEHRGPARPRR